MIDKTVLINHDKIISQVNRKITLSVNADFSVLIFLYLYLI